MKKRVVVTVLLIFFATALMLGFGEGHGRQTVRAPEPENDLNGACAVFLGDSLCAGTTVGDDAPEYGYGWGGLIGEKYEMDWANYARNGAVITQIEGQDRLLSHQVEQAAQNYATVDYVIFEGGCNDADQLYRIPEALGEISEDFENFDCTTFTGAFESLILQLITTYPDAKIGYVIPAKMGVPPYDSQNNRYHQYYDRAIEVCEKWGIPYLDLWNESPMNPALDVYFLEGISKEDAAAAGCFYTDRQHLTLRGYKRIASQIEAFMRRL